MIFGCYILKQIHFFRNSWLSSVLLHKRIPHSVWLPHSQETFFNNSYKSWFLKELKQTFWSFIFIDLLQQNMPSSFSSGSTPEKFVPGKKQSFSIIFHYSILTLIFSTWFRGNFIQSQQTAKWRCNSNKKIMDKKNAVNKKESFMKKEKNQLVKKEKIITKAMLNPSSRKRKITMKTMLVPSL